MDPNKFLKRELNFAGKKDVDGNVGYTCMHVLNGDGNVVEKVFVWDPTETVATRPLAIQKDGTWFTFGWDITKNIWELFGPAGYIRTTYSYEPFGNVSMNASGVVQPFRFSSEFYDEELDLVYYNYRHYSPAIGRFISRDPIEEQGGLNLYAFVGNATLDSYDRLGRDCLKCRSAVDVAWKQLSEYIRALDAMENQTRPGKFSPKKCHVNKPTCKKVAKGDCKNGAANFAPCEKNPRFQRNAIGTITVYCGEKEQNFVDLDAQIYHELFHAYQTCIGEVVDPDASPLSTCESLVALEIGAYCAQFSKYPASAPAGVEFKQKVLTAVKSSVEKQSSNPCVGKDITSIFDEYFDKSDCGNKTIPLKGH